ncbi:cell wall-binding protein [Lacrimispora sp. AGF001]|uniref:cell wall-binding protein n=1 Tax=Lacrimispora sp. AGF001 TaxID=3401631 RepID=UPI003B437BCF
MRKQTKLVAVLSTAALLALGASMSSFAATGWQEENGTWVYYDKSGDKETEKWEKSGDNWFYLNDDGEMATDLVVEFKDNFYYVDENGAMVTNKWVSVENEDYDGEDEPANYWYYFGSNGKAYTGSSEKASFKTVNGKKYTFDEDGKMQYGWLDENGKRNTADDAWKTADYYCGDENDGSQSIGWKFLTVTDEDYDVDTVAPNFSSGNVFDDEDQTRWFYFKSNGKKVSNEDGEGINGKKYSFDVYGRMNAEWVTKKDATPGTATTSEWRYFNSIEDGARVTKGWFKVVPDKLLDTDDYNDDSDAWFYADGKGSIIANKIKEINGKRYAFDEKGRMKDGFRLIKLGASSTEIAEIRGLDGKIDDDSSKTLVDTKDDFYANINAWLVKGYKLYNFGSGDDGSMKTGKQTLSIDGESFTFSLAKSGASRGAGKNEIDKDKVYMGGMLLKAEKDDKYAVVMVVTGADGKDYYSIMDSETFIRTYTKEDTTKDNESAAYVIDADKADGAKFKLINTAGSIQTTKSAAKDGEDNYFQVKSENIERIYTKK